MATFINLHQNAVSLLTDVSKWDTERFVFDKENFTLEMDSATPLDAESDDPVIENPKQNDPLESEESLVMHYRWVFKIKIIFSLVRLRLPQRYRAKLETRLIEENSNISA